MGIKRRKRQTPIALLWTRRDQLRFVDTVEKLTSAVNDLVVIVRELQAEHATRPRPRRREPVIVAGEAPPAAAER